jgi:DNA-binding IclR family transcriptional regulator
MAASDELLTVEQVARHFHHAPGKKVKGLLETLEALGLVERAGQEAFAA